MTATRLAFGENWSRYAQDAGHPELGAATHGLRRLLREDFDPNGRPVLAIGSGSGLHSVPLARLGSSPYASARSSVIVWYLSPHFKVLQTVGADIRQTGSGGSGCAEIVFRRTV